MGEIVNLNRRRKQRRCLEEAEQAEENRIHFGRSKADRHQDSEETKRRDRQLDDSKLD